MMIIFKYILKYLKYLKKYIKIKRSSISVTFILLMLFVVLFN